jgi:drug/metabolite transporter (DMT)-like permease
MTSLNIIILVVYALGMSVGQILFKLSAQRANGETTGTFLTSLLGNGYFVIAVFVYGFLTVVWVWVLTRVPLSQAYPFVALAFVFTPAFSWLLFGEPLGLTYMLGLALILLGLGVLVWKAG